MQPDPPSSDPASREPGASSEPSSLFGRMVEAFGGWEAIRDEPSAAPRDPLATEPTLTPPMAGWDEGPSEKLPDAKPGMVLLDRYLLGVPIGRPELRLFIADDRSTRRPVTVQLLPVRGDRPSLMAALRAGRAVAHRSVLRVHDVASTPWGALVVMEAAGTWTLEEAIASKRLLGGMSVDEIRRIGGGVAAALAAIHETGHVHGRVGPSMVLLADGAARLLASALTPDDASLPTGDPAADDAPDLLPFRSPERVRGGGPSVADDLYALGMTLWSLAAKAPPHRGLDPYAHPLRSDAFHGEISRLTPDELRQLHAALSIDPSERPGARTYRFFDSRHSSPTTLRRRADTLYPGPPPAGPDPTGFPAGSMALLVTFAATAPHLVGGLHPLRKSVVSLGRDPHADVSIADQTVSMEHVLLVWRKGAWIVTDRRSTNGTYADPGYARQADLRLRHGGEVQFGELRAMLVGFADGSPEHLAARAFLARHDGLTGLLLPAAFFDALRGERRFADWADLQLHLAVFEVHLEKPRPRDRLAVLELLVLRRLARRVIELTDALLVNLRSATAGLVPWPDPSGRTAKRTAPRVVVAWLGVDGAQARALLDTMLAELGALMPPGLVLRARLASLPSGVDPRVALDGGRGATIPIA